jgi:Arc/MetJ-type ribon-helix-helix transcriptional regulator
MKVQTTITVNEDTIKGIQERVREGSFRNKSHFFEYAAKKFLEGTK